MEDTNKDMNIDKEEAKKVKKVKKEKKARKRGRKGRIVAQIFVCFLLTVAFVASAAGGAVAAYYKAATNTITTDTKTALKNVDVVDADLEYDQDVVNILLIGCDKRADETEAGRSDSTMIATIDLKNGKLKLTSLMRDMYIDIPGYGYHKFNAAYSYGGVQLEYETIAENFGIKLDGYVEVDMEAFRDVVDLIGGVPMELTEAEAYFLKTAYVNSKHGEKNVKAQQVLIVVHGLDDRAEEEQELGVLARGLAGVEEVDARVGGHGPVVVLAGAVHALEGLFVEQADEAVRRDFLCLYL